MKIKKKHEYLATKLKGKKSFYSKNEHNYTKKATERGGEEGGMKLTDGQNQLLAKVNVKKIRMQHNLVVTNSSTLGSQNRGKDRLADRAVRLSASAREISFFFPEIPCGQFVVI